jgi:hypothetical protein
MSRKLNLPDLTFALIGVGRGMRTIRLSRRVHAYVERTPLLAKASIHARIGSHDLGAQIVVWRIRWR